MSHSDPGDFCFILWMVGGGWGPTFLFFKSLDNNMVYSLGIYILMRGFRAEQNSYGFKYLEKLDTNRISYQ